MKQIFLKLFFGFLVLTAQQAYAHGEDEPGPHGGFIRMPGAFHTEVVPVKKGFRVMLLDIQFQHSQVKDSSVDAVIKLDDQITPLKCKPEGDHFLCLATKKQLEKGDLEINAVRNKAQGAKVVYPLPLKFEKAAD